MRKPRIDHAVHESAMRAKYGETINQSQIAEYKRETGVEVLWIRKNASLKVSRGVYRIPTPADYAEPVVVPTVHTTRVKAAPVSIDTTSDALQTPDQTLQMSVPVSSAPKTSGSFSVQTQQSPSNIASNIASKLEAIARDASELATVPKKLREFVPFGDYQMVQSIVASKQFFPVFTTGLSGNGKTLFVEQACAAEGREYVRCNITTETDEDDLLGGFRLRNGETVFELGPVVIAMVRGAVLLLDEIDLASPKIMCLQPVLEGKAITIKKLNVTVAPAPGFTVFATANTKGRGSDDGKYVGAGLLNEAFLERFPVTVEQEYPGPKIETKILRKTYEALGFTVGDVETVFFDTLTKWSDAIRTTFLQGGIDDLISTRRLCHIVKAYSIFQDTERALNYCVNRFDVKTKDAFCDLYNKLAPVSDTTTNVGSVDTIETPAF